jgi:hypothetical protein
MALLFVGKLTISLFWQTGTSAHLFQPPWLNPLSFISNCLLEFNLIVCEFHLQIIFMIDQLWTGQEERG